MSSDCGGIQLKVDGKKVRAANLIGHLAANLSIAANRRNRMTSTMPLRIAQKRLRGPATAFVQFLQ